MKKVLYIDFDETLFDHAAFVRFVAAHQSGLGVDTAPYVDSFDEYHDIQDDLGLLRLYRHRQHIADKLDLDWPDFRDMYIRLVADGGHDFCYSDVHDFIAHVQDLGDVKVSLLTYGNPEYQRFKIGLCPHIAQLPVVVVDRAKTEYLSEYPDSTKGVLLDDKAPLNLPDNWQHIWVNRVGKHTADHGAHKMVRGVGNSILEQTYITKTDH